MAARPGQKRRRSEALDRQESEQNLYVVSSRGFFLIRGPTSGLTHAFGFSSGHRRSSERLEPSPSCTIPHWTCVRRFVPCPSSQEAFVPLWLTRIAFVFFFFSLFFFFSFWAIGKQIQRKAQVQGKREYAEGLTRMLQEHAAAGEGTLKMEDFIAFLQSEVQALREEEGQLSGASLSEEKEQGAEGCDHGTG